MSLPAVPNPRADATSILLSILVAASLAMGAVMVGALSARAQESASQRYIVVFDGSYALDGSYPLGGDYALNHAYALQIVAAAGGTVTTDLSKQIGVMLVESSNDAFYALLGSYALVEEIGEDFSVKAVPSASEMEQYALSADQLPEGDGQDVGTVLQWDMHQIRVPEAHSVEAGLRAVDVGILDTGIDGGHLEFRDDPTNPLSGTNVDCSRGRNSIAFVTDVPGGPGVGVSDPCVDNGFHGTHVAGTVGAQANGVGINGVAPNVTLVPVKVCDSSGHCYASAVIDGVTYAGDEQFDVINMSFFVDDDETLESTEFKCMSDPTQRAFRQAVERAMQYARNRGVTPVAALGNSDKDLAHPDEGNECEVVPAETSGVIGTASLGRDSQKAGYSNYGTGAVDVAAPGGAGTTGDCTRTILSTFPGDTYGCIQGTSMASPHAAGVAALIVSRFGTLGPDGDVKLSPTKVEAHLKATSVDIGLAGYDECFGHGRIDALRAVTNDRSSVHDASAPFCPEYDE